jgi:hypothetical protein
MPIVGIPPTLISCRVNILDFLLLSQVGPLEIGEISLRLRVREAFGNLTIFAQSFMLTKSAALFAAYLIAAFASSTLSARHLWLLELRFPPLPES